MEVKEESKSSKEEQKHIRKMVFVVSMVCRTAEHPPRSA